MLVWRKVLRFISTNIDSNKQGSMGLKSDIS
jgi:hypothetical protein